MADVIVRLAAVWLRTVGDMARSHGYLLAWGLHRTADAIDPYGPGGTLDGELEAMAAEGDAEVEVEGEDG